VIEEKSNRFFRNGSLVKWLVSKSHHRSINELNSLTVKLVFIGFVAFIIMYLIESRVVAYYQNTVSQKVLPIMAMQHDISANMVDYALLESRLLNDGEIIDTQISLLHNQTTKNLRDLGSFTLHEHGINKIKNAIEKKQALLTNALVESSRLNNINIQLSANIKRLKAETIQTFDEISELREQLSGKLALYKALNPNSSNAHVNEVTELDVSLGIEVSGLTKTVSQLMYIDNVDQLANINSNYLIQNLNEVNKILNDILQALSEEKVLAGYSDIIKNLIVNMLTVRNLVSKDGALTPLLVKKFDTLSQLESSSNLFKLKLALIEKDLKIMTVFASKLAERAVNNHKKIDAYGTVILIIIAVLFVFFLETFLSAIARQVNKPIDTINKTMEKLTQGDLTARLPASSSELLEFKSIWQDFNVFVENNESIIEEQSLIFENADIGIAWLKDRKYLKVNNKILETFGYKEEEMLHRDSKFIYYSDADYELVGELAYNDIQNGEVFSKEIEMVRSNGTKFWCKLTGKSIGLGDKTSSIWLHEDVSERKIQDEKLHYLANYDSLTGLPNRELFNIHLDSALVKSQRKKLNFAVLFIDLDRFKHINDSLGHEAGDVVLKEVSDRMQAVIRTSDVVARLGGDEFTIILDDASNEISIGHVAKKLLAELSRVINYKGNELFIGGSIGISRFPMDASDSSELLSHADAAMYAAKQSGRNKYNFYSKHIGKDAERFTQLSQDLRKAVEYNEFELFYQPKIDMHTRKILGSEALIRWNKPGVGLISPFDFIPVLEESGLMVEVGQWVISEACKAISTWRMLGYNPGKVAINLSERQFSDKTLIDHIKFALNETGTTPNDIELEITESLMMDNSNSTIEILNNIKQLGIGIAMDDFGTGYSSLAYLKYFPIDILKIDRAFVKDILTDEHDAAIVEAIITMAKQLNLKTVAEGIETNEQYELLLKNGVEIGQGYLFSKPVAFDDMVELYEGKSIEINSVA
jgi:diguanylate cyclase (GGDEF)-like protein/PAS domain S-box-containing protein